MPQARGARLTAIIFVAVLCALGSVVFGTTEAAADDCAALGGVFNSTLNECQISAQVQASGTFQLTSTLHILGTGAIIVPVTPAGSVLTLQITGGLTIDKPLVANGGAIIGDSDFAGSNPSGIAANISITTTGHIVLDGDATTGIGASITADTDPTACAGAGHGGNVTVGSTQGNFTMNAATRISSSGQCPGGEIILVADQGTISVSGSVESVSGQGGPTVTIPKGGPIWLAAGFKTIIDTLGRVSSRGATPGADLVHLESGWDTEIFGRVESVAGVALNPLAPNRCAGTYRPGKNAGATACVEVWSGGKITVDNVAPNNGLIASEAGATSVGTCCTWIDVFARRDISVRGKPITTSSAPFAVSAQQLAPSGRGGVITVKAIRGKIEAFGRAFNVNARSTGSIGGTITLHAGGSHEPPWAPTVIHVLDITSNINLNDAALQAIGSTTAPAPGVLTNGQIDVKSFNGQITGGTAGDATKGQINVAGTPGAHVTLQIFICQAPLYQGVFIPVGTDASGVPFVTVLYPQDCGGNPQLPVYITDLPKPPPVITVTDVDVQFDGNPHPAPVTVTGVNGEALTPFTVTYSGGTSEPVAVGVYNVLVTFAGNADYEPGTGTGTVTIRDATVPKVTPILTATGGTFDYDRQPHPGTVVATHPTTGAILSLPLTLTYTPVAGPGGPVNAGTYTLVATFAGDGQFNAATSNVATILIRKVTPTVNVVSATFVYDGNPHPATTSVVGVGGEALGAASAVTYNGLPAPPQFAVGTYSVAATYNGNTNYNPAVGNGTITLTPATPVVVVTSTVVLYDGVPHEAPVQIAGVNGELLSTIDTTVTYNGSVVAPTVRGVYSVLASFPGSGNYLPAQGTGTLEIVGLAVTMDVVGGTFVYDGLPHGGSFTIIGAAGEDFSAQGIVTYTNLDTAQILVAAPVDAGNYQIEVFFPGTDAYAEATASAPITITPRTPTVVVSGGSFQYDGQPHPSTVTVTGLNATVLLSPPATVTYNGISAPPVGVGTYAVVASYSGDGANYGPATGTNTTTISPLVPTVNVVGGDFVFDGQPHPATGTVRGVNNEDLGTPTFTYNGAPTAPVNVGTYAVLGSFAGNAIYGPATGTGTVIIRPNLPTSEACFLVDFREISYFRNATLFMSSDPALRAANGIPGVFDPAAWPFDPNGGAGTTTSRGTQFRIYGFAASQVGASIVNFDNPSITYTVQADPDIPGTYFIDLGGPAKVTICVPQLQTNLIGETTTTRPWTLPGGPLADTQKNVPGIMLNHNVTNVPVPQRVRDELAQLGTPLLDSQGRPTTEGLIHYVGVQLWGRGATDLREFVDVELRFLQDSDTDRAQHYRLGFHTVDGTMGAASSCDYLDFDPLRNAVRFNDVWEGANAGNPAWGANCGALEPAGNQKVREGYALPFNAIQLLPTAGGNDETARVFFGSLVGRDNGPPILQQEPNRTVTAGTTVGFTLSATDPDGDTLTYSATGLPAGAVLDPQTGAFSWTPTTAQVGAVTITFTATDPGGLSDSKATTITVKFPNRPPVLTSPGDRTVFVGSPLAFPLQATDPDGDTLTYSATGLPGGATLHPTTGAFSWPSAGPPGTYTVTFTARDPGGLSDSKTITIIVRPPNQPPVLENPGDRTIPANRLLSFTLSATDPDNDPLTYTTTNLPPGASFDAATFTFSWTPTIPQEGTYAGVKFRATDPFGLFSEQTITITVTRQNRPPVLESPGDRSTVPGTPIVFTLNASDPDLDPLSYSMTPLSGSTLNVSTGAFAWNPTPSQRGAHTVTFTATDPGDLSDSQTVTLTVQNRPPVLTSPGDRTVNTGTVLAFTLAAADADDDTLTFSATGLPTGATLDPITGAFAWTPVSGQQGTHAITFTVDDGQGGTDTKQIHITVPNRAPVLTSPGNRDALTRTVLTFPLVATDPDQDPLTYSATGLPAGATLDPGTGVFRWSPTALQTGLFTVTFTTTDPGGLGDSRTITIRVAPAEACVLVDFREITYFRANRVFMSSDAAIRAANGIAGGFNPSVWPFAANGKSGGDSSDGDHSSSSSSSGGDQSSHDDDGEPGKTRSRGTLFRIYGFAANQVGVPVPDADTSATYPVQADPDIAGAYFIDLGNKPARVVICISQLQTSLLDGRVTDAGVFPGTTKLADPEMNVPGIMLTHNAARLRVPDRVRAELRSLGTPLLDAAGNEAKYGIIDYVGLQQWGHGNESLREFIDAQVELLFDDQVDRLKHYKFGFHTAKKQHFEGEFPSCNYLDWAPGSDGARFNDVWEGKNVGRPGWGGACGALERSLNSRIRENYAVPFNGTQLLSTVNTQDDSIRIFFGTIRPVTKQNDDDDDDDNNHAPVVADPGSKTVVAGTTLTFTVSATDEDHDPLTYSATGLPSGATFNPTTRVFTWTPTAAQVGTATVTFTATDPGGLSGSVKVTITVTPPNRPPVLTSPGDRIVTARTALTFIVTATDPDGDTLTYSATGLPAGATFNAVTRTFAWTPSVAQVGTYSVTFTAKDPGGLGDSKSITITVRLNTVGNRPPRCDDAGPANGLWPPNHKFVGIPITGVTDDDGDAVTVRIRYIHQDEPTAVVGSGNTAIDGYGVGTSTAYVRAERTGTTHVPGDGRVYEIGFSADDGRGGSCEGRIFVGVPHDQGEHRFPIDSGVRYDSTVRGVPKVR